MEIISTFAIQVKHYQRRMAKAKCPTCGAVVIRQYSNAVHQKNCGCQRKVLRGEKHHLYKHGREPLLLYRIWQGIKERCNSSKHASYHRYGGRGIKVCPEWDNFSIFRNWALSKGWKKGLEIDRKDNNKEYSPNNCKLSTRAENCQNKSNNKLNWKKVRRIRVRIANGESLSSIARAFKVSQPMIRKIRDNLCWKQ